MARERLEMLMEWYERRLAPIAFVVGFVFDSFTLLRSDLLFDNIILLSHLTISAAGIALTNAYESGRLRGRLNGIAWLFPFAMQFSFGALFSGFFVLYWRSASLAGSWVFILLLAFLLIGNEFFRERYRRLVLHVSIYFVALFSYMILALPTLTGRLGAKMFLISGAASLIGIAILISLLLLLVRERIREHRAPLFGSIAGIYIAFNILYFTNVIPPIPLALKRLGTYHTVERTSIGTYRLEFEKPERYGFFQETAVRVHWVPGNPVFAFSAIFAPAKITTAIYHHWLSYDEGSKKWVERDRLAFPISGGRDGGYRGFTLKRSLEAGKWRVEVRTERGQLLGRTTFQIIEASSAPHLEVTEL